MSSAPHKLDTSIVPQVSQQSPNELSTTDETSFLERVLSSFLQERNIRWMLGIGVLILIGSSVSFVRGQWNEMQDIWKYVVLLGYSGVIHLCGQAAYHKLNLRKTGTALMAVTLLLIPLVFFSLHWVSHGTMVQGAGLAFLAAATAFSAMAARRILKHFFRGDQPSVLVCYLALSLFGAIAPVLSAAFGPLWALVAWSVFLFGSVKANREVFWLTEEHRLPRIFGFFPIALMGLQFVAIFSFYFAESLPSNDWFGLCCVMTAIPIMLSADAFAKVFKQRTGDLVRPLPWSIIGPIVLGLILCVTGLVLASTGFPHTAYPLVPTAAIFAVMMAVTARRTGKGGFVWAMLLGVVLAYQTSPVFFKAIVEQAKAAAADAVNERRLPIWYYGLTYMPLLFATSLVAKWRERLGDELFASPMRRFTIGMSALLFVVSFGNPGANFVVSATMLLFFLWQARIYRERKITTLAISACVSVAFRLVPFVEQVGEVQLPADAGLFVMAITAVAMQFLGRYVDRWFDAQSSTDEANIRMWYSSWEAAALPVTLGTVAWWFGSALPNYFSEPALLSGLALSVLLVIQSLLSPKRGFGELTIAFGLTLFCLHTKATNLLTSQSLFLATIASLIALDVFSRLTRKRSDRMAIAFSRPAQRMSCLLAPAALGIGVFSILSMVARIDFPVQIAVSGVLATGWCFREGKAPLLVVGFVSLLMWQCGVVTTFVANEWLVVSWAATAVVALQASRREEYSVLEPISLAILTIIAVGSFVFFKLPITIAGGIALVGFLLQARVSDNRNLRAISIVVANWQIIGLGIRIACPEVTYLFDITERNMLAASLPLAAFMSLSGLVFQLPWVRRLKSDEKAIDPKDIFESHSWCLTAACVAMLVMSLLHLPGSLGVLNAVCALATFACLSVSMSLSAVERKSPHRVRAALTILVGATIYLALFRVISLGNHVAMFGMLVAACVVSGFAHLAKKREATLFAVEPLAQFASKLPMGTVVIALLFRLNGATWLGMNSLAVLMSAGYYFWRGIEEKRNSLIVLAAAITNFALILLWNELKFRDPQFFMVPIGVSVLGLVHAFRREIPTTMRNPLRYAGALMILVSPTFNIVHGSWLHMFSLLVLAVLVCITAIGLRIRPLLYASTAFLIADIVAMVVLGVSDHPDKLWLFGLGAGAAVIALAAFFENQRANLTSRMRLIAAELKTWE